MSDFGILSMGAYIPRLRLERSAIAAAHHWMTPGLKAQAKGRRAFCSWDEDAVTMAVEAGRGCLGGGGGEDIEALTVASTTFPYADLLNSAVIAEALALSRRVTSVDIANSQRAGVGGLRLALQSGRESLFIATERPVAKPASVQEMAYGAGAAAFRIGQGAIIARLLGSGAHSAAFVDHFRASGEVYEYHWEERWVRDEGYLKLIPPAVEAALSDAGCAIGDIGHFVLGTPMRRVAEAAAKALGFKGAIADPLDGECGHAGTAHALLMLANVLESAGPGEKILLVGFGQGAEALVLETTDRVAEPRRGGGVAAALADAVVTDSYERMLSFYGGIELEWGMRSEKNAKTILSEQYRSSDQTAAFVAGCCPSCSTVQFPQLNYCVTPGCGTPSSQFAQVSLRDEPCRVLTYTADWLSYHPAPPLYVGFVQFDSGARLLMEMVDIGPEGLDVGVRLRSVFRIKERDRARGYNRYFWKAAPVTAEAGRDDG